MYDRKILTESSLLNHHTRNHENSWNHKLIYKALMSDFRHKNNFRNAKQKNTKKRWLGCPSYSMSLFTPVVTPSSSRFGPYFCSISLVRQCVWFQCWYSKWCLVLLICSSIWFCISVHLALLFLGHVKLWSLILVNLFFPLYNRILITFSGIE